MTSAPTYEATTKLVARALGMPPAELAAGFRPAVLADLPEVLALRQGSIASQIRWNDREYLSWRYRLGREGAGLGELWILTRNGQLLGMVGAEEMTCTHHGRRLAGQRTMDILVAPEARNSGLGVWLNQAMFPHAAFTLAVGANRNSIGTVERLFRMLPPRRTWVHPVDFRHYLARRFDSPAVAALAARAGNAVTLCWRGLARLTGESGLTIRPVERFDPRFDAPPDAGAGDSVNVEAERRADYLNRRLFDNPRARYQVWEASSHGRPLGWIAWRVARRPDGSAWIHVIDWQALVPDRRSATLGALLAFTSRQAVREGCTTVAVTLQGDADRGALRRHGYFAQPQDEATVVGLYAEPALLDQLAAARWSLTDLSVDHDGY